MESEGVMTGKDQRIDDGGPAFPTNTNDTGKAFATQDYDPVSGLPFTIVHAPGMSLRDWFAGEALKGLIERNGIYWQGLNRENLAGWLPQEAAMYAFQFSDAMIKARLQSIADKEKEGV